MPETLKEYITSSPFELHDKLGQEEVVLTRKFGNESYKPHSYPYSPPPAYQTNATKI